MGGDTSAKVPVFDPPAASREVDMNVDFPLKCKLLPDNRLSELPIKYVFSDDRPHMIGVTVKQLLLAFTCIQAEDADVIEHTPL